MADENNDNNNNLQGNKTPDKMKEPDNTAGAGKDPEDTTAAGNAYERTIEKQQETINTLLGRIDSLNAQITDYVRSIGTHVDEGADPNKTGSEPKVPEDYVYLKDLGKEIGKR